MHSVTRKTGYFTEYLHTEVVEGKKHNILQFPDGLRIDISTMKAMKLKRGEFTLSELEHNIVPYCQGEVMALERLMTRLKGYLEEQAGLFLARWDGAGACAGALFQREGIKEHMQEDTLDKALYQAMLCAYAGGRIELGKIGMYRGKVYNYDIVSAYPTAMPELPALTDGMWKYRKGSDIPCSAYSLIRVTWEFDEGLPYYPFFFRSKESRIFFPRKGSGVYWKVEVEAALHALQSGKLSKVSHPGCIEVQESWEFYPYDDTKPFAFVPEIFTLRKLWKKAKNAAEKVLKLTINSLYGKTAQSIGGAEHNKPPYHNIGYAGYITACTRAKLFDAIMQSPQNIISMQTDGIHSTVPLTLEEGDDLGTWELTEYDGIVAIQPGVYWLLQELGHEPAEDEKEEEFFHEHYWYYQNTWYKVTPHYRGFDKGVLTPQMVLDAWKNPTQEEKLKVQSTRFVTLGSALASEELWLCWRTWREHDRELDLHPTGKRCTTIPFSESKPYERLVDTRPVTPLAALLDYGKSYPYKLRWARSEDEYGTVDNIAVEIVDAEIAESQEEV